MSDSTTVDAEEIPAQALAIREPEKTALAAPVVTAAQAKVDAIAALTMAAYQRAATLELTPEESSRLQADFPDEAFQPGAAGKEHLLYIEHAHLRDRFNSVFGMGKWSIVPRNRWAEPFRTQKGDEGSRVYVEAMLIVRGCFVGEAVGAMEYYPHNASQNYGDAVEGAKTAAFRRCAKEFGVGLQAWKKEFCEGWWARKRGGRAFSKNPVADHPQPKHQTEPQAHPEAPAKPETHKPPVGMKPKPPTQATRLWMLKELEAAGVYPIAAEYFTKLQNPCPLMPGESLLDLRLPFVPNTREEMAMLITRIKQFGNGDPAEPAFAYHWEAEGKEAIQPKAVLPTGPIKDPLWWRDVIVSIPRKGMKRDEYLKAPDTLGRLFDARHKEDEESQYMRQRLWGLEKGARESGWVPKPREVNGKVFQPSDGDKKLYEALRAFSEWFADNHRGEKI